MLLSKNLHYKTGTDDRPDPFNYLRHYQLQSSLRADVVDIIYTSIFRTPPNTLAILHRSRLALDT